MAPARQLLQELHQTGCSIRSSGSTVLGELELFLEVLHQNHKTWLQLLRLRLPLLEEPSQTPYATFLYFFGESESENKYTKLSFNYMLISQHMMRNQKWNSWFVLLHEFYLVLARAYVLKTDNLFLCCASVRCTAQWSFNIIQNMVVGPSKYIGVLRPALLATLANICIVS